jgi:hypothetical protein
MNDRNIFYKSAHGLIFCANLSEKVIFYVDCHFKNLGSLFELQIQALRFLSLYVWQDSTFIIALPEPPLSV